MKRGEILALPADLRKRAIQLERNAKETLREIKGLGRSYRWEDLLTADEGQVKLFDDLELYETPCSCTD